MQETKQVFRKDLDNIKQALRGEGILPEQRELLKDYYKMLVGSSSKTIKRATIRSRLYPIYLFARYIKKPFNEVTEKDVTNYFYFLKVEGGWNTLKGGNFKPRCSGDNTLILIKSKIKMFYKWLYQGSNIPSCVNFEHEHMKKRELKEPDLLTPEDIVKLLNVCTTARDKALIISLWELAPRVGELLNQNIKDAMPDQHGFMCNLNGKTGNRTVRMIEGSPYLRDHINKHPDKKNLDSPLWVCLCKNFGTRLTYVGLANMLYNLSRRAKLNKKIHPHLFRHSRLDHLAKKGWTERDLRIFAGWEGDSKMPDVYLHYGQDHVNDKILELNGIKKVKKEQKTKVTLEPLICTNCNRENPTDAKICECGAILNRDISKKSNNSFRDDIKEMNELFRNEAFVEFYKQWKRTKTQT